MSESPGLAWTLEVGEDTIAAMSPPIKRFFLALRRLHVETKGEDGGD